MSYRHLRTSALALASGLLLLASGCGDDRGSAELNATMGVPAESPAPVLDPRAGAPVVGSCHAISRAQSTATTNTNKPVSDCYESHNSLTYHVGFFPRGTTSSDYDRVRRACTSHLPAATGLTRSQLHGTVLEWIWFEPTPTQWSAGARWFRCDLVAKVDDRLKVLPETSRHEDIFTDGLEDRYARCVRSGADTTGDGDADGLYVTCDKAHDYRWAGSFLATATGKWPGESALQAEANQRCETMTGTGTWWATWPLAALWKSGDHRISCYKQSSS